MVPVETAMRHLLALIEPVGQELVPLSQGFGRVLAADLAALRTQPPFDASAMDGYACRAADLAGPDSACLKIIGAVHAGEDFTGTVGLGEAARIFTGAPMPEGADCVVIQESALIEAGTEGDTVTLPPGSAQGTHVIPAGQDFREGDIGLRAGKLLSVRDIGLAAAMNHPWLTVRRRPRVAILPTGNEVVMPGAPAGRSQIVSSNGSALAAFVTALGGEPMLLGIARDDSAALREAALNAVGADLLITTGGASVGEHDLVESALTGHGLTLEVRKIAMRPGKPVMIGRYRGVPMLGLPGHPVSTLVCALLFMKPAVERLQGLEPRQDYGTARLTARLQAGDSRQAYLRAGLEQTSDGGFEATPFSRQSSAMLGLLAEAHCLVIRPPFAPAAEAGEHVPILRFPPAQGGY